MKEKLLIAFLALIAGFGIGQIDSLQVQQDSQVNIDFNSSMLPDGINNTVKVEQPNFNYIQPAHHKVDYEWSDQGVEIKDIDRIINIHGSSMRPTMFTGHKLLAVDYRNQTLEEGDIVYTESNFVHRIEGNYMATDDKYYTRGDNTQEGEWTKPSEIKSIVVGVLYTEK